MPDVLSQLNQEGQLCFQNGDYEKAVSCFQEAASVAIKVGLLQHYAVNMNNVAFVYRSIKEYNKAEAIYTAILERLPRRDPIYSKNLTDLADLYCENNDFGKAEVHYRQALEMQKGGLFKKKSPDYFKTASSLAIVYQKSRDYRQAETLFKYLLPMMRKELGPEHTDYEAALNGMASVYLDMGNYSKAEPLLQQVLSIRERRLGKDHAEYLEIQYALIILYTITGETTKAIPLVRQAMVNILENCEIETVLASLQPYFDTDSNEIKLLFAAILNEIGVKIGNGAEKKLPADSDEAAVESIKELTRAMYLFQKAAELGSEDAKLNHAQTVAKALPLVQKVLASILQNSEPETVFANLQRYFGTDSKEIRLLIATILNEMGVKIGNEAQKKLSADPDEAAVEPIKELTLAMKLFQKAAEWGVEDAKLNYARIVRIIFELTFTICDRVLLDPSIAGKVKKAKDAEMHGNYDEAVTLYEQAIGKVSEEHKTTIGMRLAWCLKGRAEHNLALALEQLKNCTKQHKQQIDRELEKYFKNVLRKNANIMDGRCAECNKPASDQVVIEERGSFQFCKEHYDEVNIMLNKFPLVTDSIFAVLYFVEDDLSRSLQLIPEYHEAQELLEVVNQFNSVTPKDPF